MSHILHLMLLFKVSWKEAKLLPSCETAVDFPLYKNIIVFWFTFLKKQHLSLIIQGVEKGLSEQINYLTQVATGQPHEGSTYGVEKVSFRGPVHYQLFGIYSPKWR